MRRSEAVWVESPPHDMSDSQSYLKAKALVTGVLDDFPYISDLTLLAGRSHNICYGAHHTG